MKIQAIVHRAEEGGYWGEVPSIPGCASQGETVEELMDNLREAITGCLPVPPDAPLENPDDQISVAALLPRRVFAVTYRAATVGSGSYERASPDRLSTQDAWGGCRYNCLK